MKNLKMFLLSFFISSFSISMLNAANIGGDNLEPKQELRSTIMSFLSDSKKLVKEEARSATIKFLVNTNGEIVVLDVDTDYSDIELFVKSNLNYKKVSLEDVKTMSPYTVEVTFGDKSNVQESRTVQLVNPLYDLSLSNFVVVPVVELEVICLHSSELEHRMSVARN